VPESPPGYGPALADVQAAVKRDARVVETEIVTPSLWNSVRVPTLRIFTAERGIHASPWDLSAPAGPSWENYGRRAAAGDTSDPFFADLAELDASDAGTPETGAVARTYTAVGGETPQAIASRYGALGRSRWAAELRAANPARNWTARIYSGDCISIPEAWPARDGQSDAPDRSSMPDAWSSDTGAPGAPVAVSYIGVQGHSLAPMDAGDPFAG
jgi:hypothetical protein